MRILYGVNGMGMGHAIRSKPILEYLSEKHEVFVVSGGKAYALLSRFFKAKKIGQFYILHRNNKVNPLLTFLYNFFRFPFIFIKNLSILKIIADFKPEVVISDFEPFTSYSAFICGKPLIYIDNQHIAINTEVAKETDFISRILANAVIRFFSPPATHYLIVTFFYPKIKHKNTFLSPPSLRKEILKSRPKSGNNVLIYISSKRNGIFDFLKKIDETFIVYGADKDCREKNIVFKKFSESEFIKDLASAKAFISNGSFSTIGEALHFHKPVMVIPLKKHHEQSLNGVYIKKLGYGECFEEMNENSVVFFLRNLEKYNKNLKDYERKSNEILFEELDKVIDKVVKNKI